MRKTTISFFPIINYVRYFHQQFIFDQRVVVSLRDLVTKFLSDYCLECFTLLVPHSLKNLLEYFFTQIKECCLNVLLKCK